MKSCKPNDIIKKEKNIMKNTVKTTAAILAAIMTMTCAAIPSFADGTEEALYDEPVYAELLTGGWAANDGYIAMSKNPDAKAAFKKATKGLLGVKYEAAALLGTQVVAGMNYAVLVRSTVVYPGAQPEIKVMYIYEDLDGNAEITGFQTLIGEQLEGGFSANGGKLSAKSDKTVYSTYKKAMKGLTGVSYSPAAYLGSQVVAGTNYMILCRSQVVYPGAPYKWSLVTVNRDLDGKASLADIEDLDLGSYDSDNYGEGDTAMTGIANPWTEYTTVSEAAKAAGVEFSAPKKIGQYDISYIQSMKGLVEVNYSSGENTLCIRKGTGTDDVSGDWNTYKNVSEKKINGNTVTIKSGGKGAELAAWTDGSFSYAVSAHKAISLKALETVMNRID